MSAQRTREDIDALKHNWNGDPCWDIEETEGFEAHRDELLEHSKKMHQMWEDRHMTKMMDLAEELGMPSNLQLAEYIWGLERRIKELEAKNERD